MIAVSRSRSKPDSISSASVTRSCRHGVSCSTKASATSTRAPLLALWPGLAISLTVGAFVLLGNALRDVLEDRKRSGGGEAPRQGAPPPRASVSPIWKRPPRTPITCSWSVDWASAIPRRTGHQERGRGDLVRCGPRRGARTRRRVGFGEIADGFSILGLLPDEAEITGRKHHVRWHRAGLVRRAVDFQGKMSNLRGKRIAYIPQEPMSNLDPNFTIGSPADQAAASRCSGSRRRRRSKRALQLLDACRHQRSEADVRTRIRTRSPAEWRSAC